MINHRPLQKQYAVKATVKHHIQPSVIVEPRCDIVAINISDRDRYGNIVYKGSESGGSSKSMKSLEERGNCSGLFKRGSRKIKAKPHPQSVEYNNYVVRIYSYFNRKYKRTTCYTGKSIRHLINSN